MMVCAQERCGRIHTRTAVSRSDVQASSHLYSLSKHLKSNFVLRYVPVHQTEENDLATCINVSVFLSVSSASFRGEASRQVNTLMSASGPGYGFRLVYWLVSDKPGIACLKVLGVLESINS